MPCLTTRYHVQLLGSFKSSLFKQIYVEMRGMHGDNVAPYIVYIPTKFDKNLFKIKEIIAKKLTCVWLLVNWL